MPLRGPHAVQVNFRNWRQRALARFSNRSRSPQPRAENVQTVLQNRPDVFNDSPSPQRPLESAKTALHNRADAPENFELIRSWLAQCEKHSRCCEPLDPTSEAGSFVPTRLIEFSPAGEELSVRLVLGEGVDMKSDCRYVALSHCWGDPKAIPKTVNANLQDHLREIPINSLSKTFQDAIVVTRELGLRYLWIDSLCIVQHSDQEFEGECARMHLVYSQAFCTLSAQDSSDGRGGLFIPRDRETPPEKAWDEAPCGPLSTRGWAYQEHQLSPRVVHFMRSRIVWECRLCVAAEDSPYLRYRALGKMGHDSLSRWRLFDGQNNRWRVNPSHGLEFNAKDDVYLRWLEAIQLYSAKNLSFERDRLPAIAGVASVFATITGDHYFEGHWGRDLQRSLAWVPGTNWTSEDVDLPINISGFQRPSWAWTSCQGEVQFPIRRSNWKLLYELHPDENFSLLSMEIDRTTPIAHGAESSGSLKIRGQIADVRILLRTYKIVHIQRSPESGEKGLEKRGYSLNAGPSEKGVALLDRCPDTHDLKITSINAIALRLSDFTERERQRQRDFKGARFEPLGLLLLREDGGCYRRIGVYDQFHSAGFHWKIEDLTIV